MYHGNGEHHVLTIYMYHDKAITKVMVSIRSSPHIYVTCTMVMLLLSVNGEYQVFTVNMYYAIMVTMVVVSIFTLLCVDVPSRAALAFVNLVWF